MRSRIPLVLAASLVLPLVLAGCSATAADVPSTRDPSAHALLDRDTGEIVLPLTEYDFYGADSTARLANHATDIAFSHCMEKAGFIYSPADVNDDSPSRIGDRTYGIWNEEQARLYGYGSAPSAIDAAFDSDRKAGGEAWQAAYDDCLMQPDEEVAALKPDNDELTTSLVPRLQTDAYNAASTDPDWQAARESWWKCLRAEGLEPRTGSGEWTSRQGVAVTAAVGADGQPTDKEEEIRVAFTEAHCNNETGLTQTLGDLEASYQAPLIAANQVALNEVKTKNQERLDALRDYISRNG